MWTLPHLWYVYFIELLFMHGAIRGNPLVAPYVVDYSLQSLGQIEKKEFDKILRKFCDFFAEWLFCATVWLKLGVNLQRI